MLCGLSDQLLQFLTHHQFNQQKNNDMKIYVIQHYNGYYIIDYDVITEDITFAKLFGNPTDASHYKNNVRVFHPDNLDVIEINILTYEISKYNGT